MVVAHDVVERVRLHRDPQGAAGQRRGAHFAGGGEGGEGEDGGGGHQAEAEPRGEWEMDNAVSGMKSTIQLRENYDILSIAAN